MKILVTGGAGFIGSSVVRRAISLGHHVVNLDALTYAACLDNVASVADHPAYHFEHANICDPSALTRIFNDHKPDAVIHLAAESHVDRSIDAPSAFVETNVTGTCTLLDAAQHYWHGHERFEAFRFLHISTDEVFGSLGPVGKFTETTPYDPRSPYSASKAASDHFARAWGETYGLPVLLSNCSNNYGAYQFPEKLIPLMITSALAGDKLPIYGDGSNVRDWLFVDDHTDALLTLLAKGEVGRSYNIGGNAERTNLQLVHALCTILDIKRPRNDGRSYREQITFVTDRPGHDARYAIDATRIQTELGWQPQTTLEQGLERTVDWYLENEEWWKTLQDRDGIGRRLGTL